MSFSKVMPQFHKKICVDTFVCSEVSDGERKHYAQRMSLQNNIAIPSDQNLIVTVTFQYVSGSLSWNYTHAACFYFIYLISFLLHCVGGITWLPSQSGCFGEEINPLSLPETEPCLLVCLARTLVTMLCALSGLIF
jgi:hypothetical protein